MRNKSLLSPGIVLLMASPLWACPYCEQRPLVWAGIFNEDFWSYFFQVLAPIPVLIGIGLAFHLVDRWPAQRALSVGAAAVPPIRRGPLLAAGITLGIGLGGFLDGIFLHHLMQWHNLIAERVPPVDFVSLEVNMFWDGVFNLGMWLVVAVGLGLLWRASRQPNLLWSGKTLLGCLLAGWGIFNIVDSIFFHWIFHLHHIKQGAPDWLFWDIAYFVMGLALIAIGWLLVRVGHGDDVTRPVDLAPAP